MNFSHFRFGTNSNLRKKKEVRFEDTKDSIPKCTSESSGTTTTPYDDLKKSAQKLMMGQIAESKMLKNVVRITKSIDYQII